MKNNSMRLWIILVLLPLTVFSQFERGKPQDKGDLNISPFVEGSLIVPKNIEKPPLAILIGGSGPVDRDGKAGDCKFSL